MQDLQPPCADGQFAAILETDVGPECRMRRNTGAGALDGGGTLSLKTDAQGKVYSTALLRAEIDVPDEVLASLGNQ